MNSPIWFKKDISINDLSHLFSERMLAHLKIKIESISSNSLILSMPVTEEITQPLGLLHGGASCVLAESVGSIASNMVVDYNTSFALGLELNATHLSPAKVGEILLATCTPIKLGKTIHSWDISIYAKGRDSIISKARLTTMIKKKS